MIANATLADVCITNAPCIVHSKTTRIGKGASGTIEKSCQMPWALRLEFCLNRILEEERPVLGIMDAPSFHEIRDAVRAVRELSEKFQKISDDGSKRIVLEGPSDVRYMSMQNRTQAEPLLVLKSNTDMWRFLQEPFSSEDNKTTWSHIIETELPVHDSMRLTQALSAICGSTVSYSDRQLHYSFPEGTMVPNAMVKYVKCSTGIKQGSLRVSRTRGITAVAIDGSLPVATVVVQTSELDEVAATGADGQALQLVKSMVEASDAATIGAAYFSLKELMPSVSNRTRNVCNQAMNDVDVRFTCTRSLTAPSFGRQASYAMT